MKIRPSHRHKRRNQAVFQASLVTANPRVQKALIAGLCFLSARCAIAQTSTELSSGVVERGEDFAIYQRVTAVTDALGARTLKTNQFTLLETAFTTSRMASGKRVKI